MSKLRKLTKTKPAQPQQPKAQELLQLAAQQMQSGKHEWAVNSARRALEFAQNAGESQAASKILAEGALHLALQAKGMDSRLQHLDDAILFAPNDPRLHFHRGITLWRLGQVAPAVIEFEDVVTGPLTLESLLWVPHPQQNIIEPLLFSELTYLYQLVQLAAGAAWDAEDLPHAEANTLSLLQALLDGKSPAQLKALAAQPLVGDSALWQKVIELKIDPKTTEIGSLLDHKLLGHKRGIGEQSLYTAILHYFQGIVAKRQEKPEEAKEAWLSAQQAGLQSPRLMLNLGLLLREEIIALAEKGEWREAVRHAERYPAPHDAAWSEVVALAYFHLGYQEAQTGDWRSAANHWRMSSQYQSTRHLSQNLALAEEAMENWGAAAEAWRDMIRRRPRKADHPDYLDDPQVSALWEHIADCYLRAEMESEVATCLQNALKYSPDNLEIRLKLTDIYMNEQRWDAAQNELGRILERDENHVEALTRLATLYQEDWRYDAKKLWRRILAIDPNHAEAKEGLTEQYLRQAQMSLQVGQSKRAIEFLKEGLKEFPDSPLLLLMLGKAHSSAGQTKPSRDYLLQAYHAAPQNVIVVGQAIHDLLHASADDVVESLLPQIYQIPGLQPQFWVDQGEQVLSCELGETWARRFFDAAVNLAESPILDDSKAGILLDIYQAATVETADELAQEYRQRIQADVPDSGAVEYVEAFESSQQRGDMKKTRRLLHKAKQRAKRAKDQGVLRRVETLEVTFAGIFGPGSNLEALRRLFAQELFGSENTDDLSDFF